MLLLAVAAAFPAVARSAFDFDVNHIPLSYVTRSSDNFALTNSSVHTWLGANGRIEMAVTLTSTSGNQVFFAQGANSNSTCWELLLVNGNWRLGYKGFYRGAGYPNNGGTGRWNDVTPTADTAYGIVCERKDGKLYLTINDVVLVDGEAVDEPGRSEGLTFFHRKSGGNWNNCPSAMKFHYARIYNDGVLEAEYVPCIYKVFIGGIYDVVGGVEDYASAVGFDWDERAEKLHEKFCNRGKADGRDLCGLRSRLPPDRLRARLDGRHQDEVRRHGDDRPSGDLLRRWRGAYRRTLQHGGASVHGYGQLASFLQSRRQRARSARRARRYPMPPRGRSPAARST